MTQNGPYPGPRSHPWSSSGSPDESYAEPADPWGENETVEGSSPWGAHPASMPPAMDASGGYSSPGFGAPAPPGWAPAPPPRRRNTPIVALVVVLGLLMCGGLGTTAWLITQRESPAQGVGPTATSGTAAPPATDAAVDPEPRTSADARFVTKGQCVHNEGTAATPDMRIVACASGTFEVLKRVDGRTTGETDAESKCARVAGYTKWYFYDSELDSLDFVLCMRDR